MIYIHNEYDEIIETYNNTEHLYKVMKSRYTALQNKRKDDLRKEFNRGWIYGAAGTLVSIGLFFLIFKLF